MSEADRAQALWEMFTAQADKTLSRTELLKAWRSWLERPLNTRLAKLTICCKAAFVQM